MNKASNYLYTGDNLHFLYRLNSESVDLIYLDPPFNSKRTYSAPIGSKAAGASFKDMWSWNDIDEELLETLFITHPCLVDFIKSIQGLHGKPMMAYVLYMAQRFVEMHRALKPTGSIYLHCDPTASHYLKLVMDKIFGRDNFRNEVVWHYRRWTAGNKNFQRMHDIILRYTKSDKFTFNVQYEPYGEWIEKDYRYVDEETGKRWRWHTVKGKRYKVFLDDPDKGVKLNDVWVMPHLGSTAKERTGYPTQKPLTLLNRIIKASSNEGDVVLDPFCGCATTCVAAQQLNRKWIGIDIEAQAAKVLVERLGDDAGLFKDFVHTKKFPDRTDIEIKQDSESVRQKLYKAQKGKCNACDYTADHIRHFELDHIIPKDKGGSDTEGNYQLLCPSCNRIKGNRPMEYLKKRLAQIDKLLATQITFDK